MVKKNAMTEQQKDVLMAGTLGLVATIIIFWLIATYLTSFWKSINLEMKFIIFAVTFMAASGSVIGTITQNKAMQKMAYGKNKK